MIIRLLILFIYTITPAFAFTGVASYYGKAFHNKKMANGKRFNMFAFTCAHKTMKLGIKLLVKRGHKKVIVQLTDRGPYIKGRDLDLSYAAAKSLGISGIGKVTYEIIQ